MKRAQRYLSPWGSSWQTSSSSLPAGRARGWAGAGELRAVPDRALRWLGLPLPTRPAHAETTTTSSSAPSRTHKDDGDTRSAGSTSTSACFVLEAKQSRQKGGTRKSTARRDLFTADEPRRLRGRRGAERAWDVLMMNARRQAEDYAGPAAVHGWPPFILVCDVGHCIEVYADFSGQGKN